MHYRYGTMLYYNILVTLVATDNGDPRLSSTCFFLVQVTDINDNNPTFDEFINQYEVLIASSTPVNDEVSFIFCVSKLNFNIKSLFSFYLRVCNVKIKEIFTNVRMCNAKYIL